MLNYKGDLYARIGRRYLKLQMTAAEVDKIVQENEQLKSKIRSNLRWAEQYGNDQMYMKLNSILNELKEMY